MEKLGVSVLLVTFESRDSASAYIQETGISWPVIIDEQHDLYNRYDMDRAGFWDIWGVSTWWAYLKQLMKGNVPKSSSGDINRRGGDVLIDNKGIIQFHHVGTGPADRPSVDSILWEIRKAQQQKKQGEEN